VSGSKAAGPQPCGTEPGEVVWGLAVASRSRGQAQNQPWPGGHAGGKDTARLSLAMTWCGLRPRAVIQADSERAGRPQGDSWQPTPA